MNNRVPSMVTNLLIHEPEVIVRSQDLAMGVQEKMLTRTEEAEYAIVNATRDQTMILNV